MLLYAATILWLLCGLAYGHCGQCKDCKEFKNVALQGRATQSSAYIEPNLGYLASANNGIDGNLDADYMHGSCVHTNNDPSSWWRVDLFESHIISNITITNRGDCCGERLDGAEILVGDSLSNNGNDNPRCATITTLGNGKTGTFTCNMIGRYVSVILRNKNQWLHFAELQVFGVPLC
ncbi:fucolectin-like [Gastrophryne carolinensis]